MRSGSAGPEAFVPADGTGPGSGSGRGTATATGFGGLGRLAGGEVGFAGRAARGFGASTVAAVARPGGSGASGSCTRTTVSPRVNVSPGWTGYSVVMKMLFTEVPTKLSMSVR